MGSHIPFDDDISFNDHVKNMDENELLEIWEETQRIDALLHSEVSEALSIAPDFEKAIVHELSLRSSRGTGNPAG